MLEAQRLPKGHVDREAAKEAYEQFVDREYGACRALEKRWMKRMKSRAHPALSEIPNLVWEICDRLGVSQPSWIYFDSSDALPGAGAHYQPKDRTLHFYGYASLRIVVHETAHHVKHVEKMEGPSHGEHFVWCEDMAFKAIHRFFQESNGNV